MRFFPRINKEINPRGITLFVKKTFNDLDPRLQTEVKEKRKTLAQAIKENVENNIFDGAKTILLTAETKEKINKMYLDLREQNETSREIFNNLSLEEEINIRNAIAYHIYDGRKNLEPVQKKDGSWVVGPSRINIYSLIDTIKRNRGNYFYKFHTVEEIWKKAKYYEQQEKKEILAKKYAEDLASFVNKNELELTNVFYSIFKDSSSEKWHNQISNSIDPEIFSQILDKVRKFEDEVFINTPNDPRKTGKITDSFLSILNPTKQKELLGDKFNVNGITYSLWRLFNKKDLEEESKVLGHCVGTGNTYYFKIRGENPDFAIISIRNERDEPEYTIEINLRKLELVQFKGLKDQAISPFSKDSHFPLTIFNLLEKNGLAIKSVKESFDYSIIKKNGEFIKTDETINRDYILSHRNIEIVKAPIIVLESDTTTEEFTFISQIIGLNIDATNVKQEVKNQILSVKGNITDNSTDSSYEKIEIIYGNAYFRKLKTSKGFGKLIEIGGGGYFDSLENSEGLNSLTKILGTANFPKLQNAEGLSKLNLIDGTANFRNLKNAENLYNLTKISGNAYFDSLEVANGLKKLETIGWGAYLGKLKKGEKDKIPAFSKKS